MSSLPYLAASSSYTVYTLCMIHNAVYFSVIYSITVFSASCVVHNPIQQQVVTLYFVAFNNITQCNIFPSLSIIFHSIALHKVYIHDTLYVFLTQIVVISLQRNDHRVQCKSQIGVVHTMNTAHTVRNAHCIHCIMHKVHNAYSAQCRQCTMHTQCTMQWPKVLILELIGGGWRQINKCEFHCK